MSIEEKAIEDQFFSPKEDANKQNPTEKFVGSNGSLFQEDASGELVSLPKQEDASSNQEKTVSPADDKFDYSAYDKLIEKKETSVQSHQTTETHQDPKEFEITDDDDIQTVALKTAKKVTFDLEQKHHAEISDLKRRLDERDNGDSTKTAETAREKLNASWQEKGLDPDKMFGAVDKYFRSLPEDHKTLLRRTYPDPYERVLFVQETMDRKLGRTFDNGVKYATDIQKQRISAPNSRPKIKTTVGSVNDLNDRQFRALDRDIEEGIIKPLQHYALIH